ncbi:GatB/YqeY domain-containing protein [Candidatus Daviesbacteria bacterium]|nr:GatB/YqeY domain-containing protein [Candidatus Daviesbacteria bacterium]
MIGKIQNDLKNAQFARDEVKVSTLRLLLSEVRNAEINKGGSLSDEDVISLVQKEVKKRKEAALGFRQGGREGSAKREEAELKVLESYLPAQLSNEELTKIVEETISEVGASSTLDIGKVMGMVMSKVAGKADGGSVSQIVKEKLSNKS